METKRSGPNRRSSRLVCPGCGRTAQQMETQPEQYEWHDECQHCELLVPPIPASSHKAKALARRYDSDQVLREQWAQEREAFISKNGKAAWNAIVDASVIDL
jgi:hypothetical protein